MMPGMEPASEGYERHQRDKTKGGQEEVDYLQRVCVYVCVYVCLYVYMYIYIYIYIYIYTHTHTRI